MKRVLITTALSLTAIACAFAVQAVFLVPYTFLKRGFLDIPPALDPMAVGLLATTAVILVVCFFQRFTAGGSIRELAFEPGAALARPLSAGAAIGLVAFAALVATEVLSGALKFDGFFWDAPSAYPLWYAVGAVLPRYLGTAIGEELLFRGYLFHLALTRHGRSFSVLYVSVAFSLVHAVLPGYNAVVFVNAALAGVVFSLLVISFGNLWAPIGMHAAWNYVQDVVFSVPGTPIAGMKGGRSLLVFAQQGNPLLHGGAYWAEGSLICTGVFIALIVLLARRLTYSRLPLSPRGEGKLPISRPSDICGVG